MGYGGAGQANEGAGAEGDARVGGGGEAEVGFHGAVLIAGADGAECEFEVGGIVGVGRCGGLVCHLSLRPMLLGVL